MAPRPPYATDEPDSFYDSAKPQARIRHPAPPNPNNRTSAYNVYDNYLTADANNNITDNRQSGVGALGMGLLNMSDSDNDDSDDDTRPASKNAALAAATRANPTRNSPLASPPKQQQQPQDIAAPRPGYPAPIAALNLARPENATTRAPPPQPIQIPTLENPFEPSSPRLFVPGVGSMPASPAPSSSMAPSPHPLQPPLTPITPVFALPSKNIKISEPIPRNKPIMRGGSEDVLLPGRGEKGDDFWRRFSMVVKMEDQSPERKDSWWLKKTQSGRTRLSRWVWVIASLLIICIVAASVLGWYFSRGKPDHQAPTAFGGSANERPVTEVTITGATTSTNTVKHVSPTHTVARRQTLPTGLPQHHSRAIQRRKLLFDSVLAH